MLGASKTDSLLSNWSKACSNKGQCRYPSAGVSNSPGSSYGPNFREWRIRDCLETPNGLRFVVPRTRTRGRNGAIFGALRYRGKRDPPRLDTFQTVSTGSSVPEKNPSRQLDT